MHLTLKTLGTLEASTEDAHGVMRTLARGKPVAMLAYLACIPGNKASREHLASLLWGDVDTEAARQNLRQTLWYLKKKLGDGLLDGAGDMLGLVAPFSCDRDEFLQAAHRADFAAAVQRHPGPFIPDFAAPGAAEFEQWSELERRRLTVTFLRCADALARQWLGEGKFRDAQELARQARDVDPMDQASWRLLLEALVAGSDGLGATSEAEHFEAFLAREEQEPEAASLAAIRMARRSPSAPSSQDTSPSSTIAAELVGREAEFSHVLAAWEQVRAGSPRVMVVSAAAGLGKSRLLRDVQARLRASRSRCLLVRANPGDRHLSGGFVAELASQLATLSGSAAVSPGSAGVLVALAPALASTYGSAVPDRSEGEEAVRRRALAIVDLAHAVSDEHPVALLLDDLHWADEHSARVIAAALSRLEHARLLVVMTKRPVPDPRGLFAPFDRLELPPLDLAAVTAFVMQVAELPSAPWAEMLPQQLLLATGGSPLLLVETLHDALEQGWMSVSAIGAWQCDDPARITASLRDGSAVRQRVLRLAPTARHALLALAIVGRPIALVDALALMEGRAVDIDEPLEVLERGGFIARVGASVVVAHDEIADAAIAAAGDEERRRVHAGVAHGLLSASPDETAVRRGAEHAVAAEDHVLVQHAWRLFLPLRRRNGDRRSTRVLAADLLGRDSGDPAVRRLVATTPMLQRQRTRWFAAAGALCLAALALLAAQLPAGPTPLTADFVVWTVDSITGEGKLVGVRIDPNASWEAGAPLEAVDLDSTDFPARPSGLIGPMFRSPNGRDWWGNGKFSDMGDEGIVRGGDGTTWRPFGWQGDDGIGSISPDGNQIAAMTARYDTVTDHLQVIRLPLRGGPLERIASNQEYDRLASWRPDGTQIATQRHYYQQYSKDRVCILDLDGAHERCLSVGIAGDFRVDGWMDERRLLVEVYGEGFWAMDAASGALDRIPGIVGSIINLDGDLRLCSCRVANEDAPSLYVLPATQPADARPILYRGRPLRGSVHYAASFPERGLWLDSLRIRLPVGGMSVDNVHRLTAEGRRANGAPAWLHDLRWTSRDTSVATIDSTGRLRPKRLGTSWIIVSAGGWRRDSALVTITPPSSRTVIRESWDEGWMKRWRVFGTPAAIVVSTARGPALLPNGDGSYPSGAYSPTPIAVSSGVGFEAELSLKITRTQWQTLGLDMRDPAMLTAIRPWDHRTGDSPDLGRAYCALGIPGDEGVVGLDYMSISGRVAGSARVEASPELYNGSWHRYRLQLLPDGRCALAIDGRPVGILQSNLSQMPKAVVPMIAGHDRFGGQLVVGKFEAWSGVRGGVDWTALDADTSVRRP